MPSLTNVILESEAYWVVNGRTWIWNQPKEPCKERSIANFAYLTWENFLSQWTSSFEASCLYGCDHVNDFYFIFYFPSILCLKSPEVSKGLVECRFSAEVGYSLTSWPPYTNVCFQGAVVHASWDSASRTKVSVLWLTRVENKYRVEMVIEDDKNLIGCLIVRGSNR